MKNAAFDFRCSLYSGDETWLYENKPEYTSPQNGITNSHYHLGAMMRSRSLSIFTLAVQGDHSDDQNTAIPAVPPIIPAVGFIHPTMQSADHALGSEGGSAAHPDEYIYARHGAPTQSAFEDVIAGLEGAEGALSFSSGMAATLAALLSIVPAGGRIVAAEQLYGTTHTLLGWLSENMGVAVQRADFLDLGAVDRLLQETRPHAVICEVLTNPLVRVIQLDEVVRLAHSVDARVVVDNTFATPYILQPLAQGAEVVVHSATKFLNGHGDVLGGVIAGSQPVIQKARTHRRVLGALLGPFEAWLALRGVRTLAVRMRQASSSAQHLAEWLNRHEQVSQVYYPGLTSDPGHVDATRLFRENTYGAMLAFEIAQADREMAFRFVECLKLIRPVTSLGDVNTLVSHPATASHRGLTSEQRATLGIHEGTLRISVGIEDPDDLVADLEQAFQALG